MAKTTKSPARRSLSLITTTPWAITSEALETILAIAQRENLTPEAIEAQTGQPLENTQDVTIRDGVATLFVTGPLMRYATFFSRISGATSYDILATDFTAALENPEVRAILLAIDSPGGEVNGCADLAEMIFAARDRKPIIAQISGLGCSGAYWLAAAASEVVVSSTAIVGSLGAVMAVIDDRKRQATQGVQRIEFVSSQSPKKRVDPTQAAGQAEHQALVDALAEQFVAAVARYRGVSVETVLADFGQGGVFVGRAAVDAGLADRVGTYEDVQAELSDGSRAGSILRLLSNGRGAASTKEHQMAETTTPPAADPATEPASGDPIVTANPDAPPEPTGVELTPAIVAERHPDFVAAWRQEGATAERERILAIQALSIPGHEALIASCVAEAECTPAAAALRVLQAQRAQRDAADEGRATRLQALKGDEARITAPAPVSGEEPTGDRAIAARVLSIHTSLTGGASAGNHHADRRTS